MKDKKTVLQERFEKQTPTILEKGISTREYMYTYMAWLEFQVEKYEKNL